MIALLRRLAAEESPSLEPGRQRGPFRLLASELEAVEFDVRAVHGEGVGDHLYARPRRRSRHGRRQLLIGHMDTVWPVGTLTQMPVREEDGVLYGPGVADMKGGLVVIVFALRALHELGLTPAVASVPTSSLLRPARSWTCACRPPRLHAGWSARSEDFAP